MPINFQFGKEKGPYTNKINIDIYRVVRKFLTPQYFELTSQKFEISILLLNSLKGTGEHDIL